jgi:hypothetical protein
MEFFTDSASDNRFYLANATKLTQSMTVTINAEYGKRLRSLSLLAPASSFEHPASSGNQECMDRESMERVMSEPQMMPSTASQIQTSDSPPPYRGMSPLRYSPLYPDNQSMQSVEYQNNQATEYQTIQGTGYQNQQATGHQNPQAAQNHNQQGTGHHNLQAAGHQNPQGTGYQSMPATLYQSPSGFQIPQQAPQQAPQHSLPNLPQLTSDIQPGSPTSDGNRKRKSAVISSLQGADPQG